MNGDSQRETLWVLRGKKLVRNCIQISLEQSSYSFMSDKVSTKRTRISDNINIFFQQLRLTIQGDYFLSSSFAHGVICHRENQTPQQSCTSRLFLCSNLEYILDMYICDGHMDCSDGSDEFSCKGICLIQNQTEPSIKVCLESCKRYDCSCGTLYFQCNFRGCIPLSFVCNFHPD